MQAPRTINQSMIRVLVTAVFVLAFGLVVNQFADGEGWRLGDFILAEVMVAGAVLVYEMALRFPGSLISAVLSAGVAATGGAAMIFGEVDDAPGLIVIGMGLVLAAVWMGFRSARGAAAGRADRASA